MYIYKRQNISLKHSLFMNNCTYRVFIINIYADPLENIFERHLQLEYFINKDLKILIDKAKWNDLRK